MAIMLRHTSLVKPSKANSVKIFVMSSSNKLSDYPHLFHAEPHANPEQNFFNAKARKLEVIVHFDQACHVQWTHSGGIRQHIEKCRSIFLQDLAKSAFPVAL